jgi:hypothetical protein
MDVPGSSAKKEQRKEKFFSVARATLPVLLPCGTDLCQSNAHSVVRRSSWKSTPREQAIIKPAAPRIVVTKPLCNKGVSTLLSLHFVKGDLKGFINDSKR